MQQPDTPRELDMFFRIESDGSQSGLGPTNVTPGTAFVSCVNHALIRLKYPPAARPRAELSYVLRFSKSE